MYLRYVPSFFGFHKEIPGTEYFVVSFVVCVIPFVLDVRHVDAPAAGSHSQEEDHTNTGFLHLPSAVLVFIFIARIHTVSSMACNQVMK